jgi:hypothetical protein
MANENCKIKAPSECERIELLEETIVMKVLAICLPLIDKESIDKAIVKVKELLEEGNDE